MKAILVFAICLLFAVSASATVRMLDNSASAMPTAYSSAQIAHDSSAIGDTIFVIGSGASYGNLTTTKSLKWFGPGYYLSGNPETQANTGAARLASVTLNTGSAGSMFSGFTIQAQLCINTGNILVRRCHITFSGASSIVVGSTVSNVVIEQSVIYNTNCSSTTIALNSSHSITIQNCSVQNVADPSFMTITSTSDGGPYTVLNNNFSGSLSVYNALIDNNIMIVGNFNPCGSGYHNNLGNLTQFGTANGNLSNVNMTNMFSGNAATDACYILSATSVARGAGVGGVDCGMFGGVSPYVLSGIPNLPTITNLTAPTTGSTLNGMPVTFRARGRN